MNDTRVLATRPFASARPSTEEHSVMMMPEEMSRIRHQQLRQEADEQRMARRLCAGRWWRRLATYAARRADRLQP
ncbi:hypothetical protein GIY23_04760 [Allosaccharopolyspora coralli]|uniref:Uncharacterized protein n=1 Tax=Allosaccharopolyspora coralli TaxID=2665642 RepID=A0A5Q3Q534_9PSEU|nr:hypothetical protein [Allosaccharopolyspora coralli]QGK68940.1 hypothetical protein GIY23_04760 [Allosaccharopolyspora coralli]